MLSGGWIVSCKNGKNHMGNYLLNHISRVSNAINKAENVALFLDYDGTLVFFEDRPQDVVTSNEVKAVIKHILQNEKFYVFIVTGRTLDEIKKLLDIGGLSYAALHGLDIVLQNGKNYNLQERKDFRSILNQIKKYSEDEFKNEKGVYLEDKELTLAFHYRMVEKEKSQEMIDKFLNLVNKVGNPNSIDVLHGSKVVEIRPKGWNKGKAVELILKKVSKNKNFLPIYIGDDTTDEDAFNSIGSKGITIFVENNEERSTSAQYSLKNPNEVLDFLKMIQ